MDILNNKNFVNVNLGITNSILIKKKKSNNTYIYIYNNFFYYYFKLPKNAVFFPELNYIKIFSLNDQQFNNQIEKFFKIFFKTWILIFFQKIKFTGKGYKLRKKNKAIKFYFGRSHITIIWFKNFLFKKYGKNKILLLSKNKNNLRYLYNILNKIRKINIFTKRGLRFVRQRIKKKIGKKSSYM